MFSQKKQHLSHPLSSFFKFFIPSIIGIFLFMIPLPQEDSITIPIAILSTSLQNWLKNYIYTILLIIISISALGSLITFLWKPLCIINKPFLNVLFNTSWIWLTLRILSFVFISCLCFFQSFYLLYYFCHCY